jgi:hypothetical protein
MNGDDFSTCVNGGSYEGNGVNNRTIERIGFVNLLSRCTIFNIMGLYTVSVGRIFVS